jgi:hypothetical protein
MHAAHLLIEVERYAGRWSSIRELAARAELAAEANAATPCATNVYALLTCAVASVRLGDDEEARRLERAADDFGMEGYRFESSRAELAVARGDLETLERILEGWRPEGFWDHDGVVSWINALVALERRDTIETEVPPFLKSGTYLEPFVLRALGFARGDEDLVRQAIGRFEEIGMAWHAEDTRRLLPAT